MKIVTLIIAIAAGVFAFYGTAVAEGSLSKKASVETVKGSETIVTDKAFKLFEESAYFLDVRSKTMYDKSRIPGSVNLFYKDKETFNEAAITAAFSDKSKPIVVYCGGLYCPLSAPAIKDLIGWGYEHVYYYREGTPAWEKAGLPVE